MKIGPSLSAYLDFLRFFAAMVVMLAHMQLDGFMLDWLPLIHFSHEAVVVFFVMSGLIIYASTASRNWDAREYLIARVSRVYSVALPAVLFCSLLALGIDRLAPQLRSAPSFREPHLRDIAGSLVFINESWSSWLPWDLDVPLNAPFWSLCYEVWYYIIFGLFVFSDRARRWWIAGIAAIVAGPAVMLLMPVWLMGTWLAKFGSNVRPFHPAVAWVAYLGSTIVIAALGGSDIDLYIRGVLHSKIPGFWRFEASQRFVTDYILGLLVVIHVHAYTQLPATATDFFVRHRPLLARLAGFSFTLYLFHRPMTALVGQVLRAHDLHSPWLAVLYVPLFAAACWIISLGTERQLPAWRAALQRLGSARVAATSQRR